LICPGKKIPSSAVLAGLLICAAAPAPAQVDTETLDYDLFLETLVDDPDRAGPGPYHLWKIATDGDIPIRFSAGTGLVWADLSELGQEPAMPFNFKIRKKGRLEVGGAVDRLLQASGIAAFTLGIKHQIHRCFAWGLNLHSADRKPPGEGKAESARKSATSFVFLANEKHFLGTRIGMKYKFSAGLGDAITRGGVALQLGAEGKLEASESVAVLASLKGRSRSEGFSAELEINGLLGATLRLFGGPSTLRATLGYGLAGDSRQDRLSGSLFLNFRQ